MLQAESNLAGDVLLGILWSDGRKQPLQRSEIAARDGHGDPVIQSHQVRGQGAAPRAAGAAEAPGIDLWARGQIIQAANAVPDPVRGRILSGQQGADANQGVLGSAARQGGLSLTVQ